MGRHVVEEADIDGAERRPSMIPSVGRRRREHHAREHQEQDHWERHTSACLELFVSVLDFFDVLYLVRRVGHRTQPAGGASIRQNCSGAGASSFV